MTEATPRPRPFYPLRTEAREDGSIDLFTPAEVYRRRGLVLALALPALLLFLGVAANSVAEPEGEEFESLVTCLGVSCLVSLGAGICMVLLASYFSARTRWRITRATDMDSSPMFLFSRAGKSITCRAGQGIRAVMVPGLLDVFGLWVVDSQGHDVCRLVKHVPRSFRRELARTLHDLNVYFGAVSAATAPTPISPFEAPSYDASGRALPKPSERSLAMLCYLPIQGIFLFASLGVLLASRSAYARAAAKQSLLQLAFSSCLLGCILLGLGLPLAFSSGSAFEPFLIAALAIALTAFWLWNLIAHIYACVRFYRGAAWVMPWLRPVARRWISEPPG